ncbi:putative bifunctional diguanylate cyclase/phosphodiesterase [Aquabacterium sp.]|uniref:putative bifunctional diguanylate cyclase/phosphodiesterase n=1 Tax=Aquabacterium sp. TaxID=1872578 RepID=UPI0035AECD87
MSHSLSRAFSIVQYTFAIYMAVTLITGAALLMVWRQDRSQSFTAQLGLSHLIWTGYPVAYFATHSTNPLVHGVGVFGLSIVPSLCLTLMVAGIGSLSRRQVARPILVAMTVTLTITHVVVISHDMGLMQGVSASINIAISLMLANWLWRMGVGERITAGLLILAGLNQFNFVLQPTDQGAMLQTVFATVLRLMLALALMYAAINRTADGVRRMRDRFFLLTERAHQGVAVIIDQQCVYSNPAFMSAYRVDKVVDAPAPLSESWLDRTSTYAERVYVRKLLTQLRNGSLAQAEWEGERRALDGQPLYLRFKAWPVEWDGQPAIQIVMSDETAQHESARALLWQATHDELTGLPNRSALLQRLREGIADSRTASLALVLLDVDRFKFFNDAHGHTVGDEVLQSLATRLQRGLEDTVEVMRLGEDEFALLLRGPDAENDARRLTDAVKQLLAEPLRLTAHEFFLDVSMGVAVYPQAASSPEPLLQAANAAMHAAKRLPGTSVSWASEQQTQHLASSFRAEQALRAGLHHEEFTLMYQPKVAANTGALLGFEALVRWDRPGIGRISPMDFIPAAERNGLIVPLGELIITQACRQIANWRVQGFNAVPVAVNVSPLQLLDVQFPVMVMKTLKEFDIPPQCLSLEITETAAVAHMDQACEQITQLRQYGIDVALDDFGTGFSSLNMLRSLPLRTVKIDRSLIDPMPHVDAIAVVKAICDLAAVLQLKVVAEGVETEDHARAALQAGCDALQGYLFAKPLEVDEATRWLGERY